MSEDPEDGELRLPGARIADDAHAFLERVIDVGPRVAEGLASGGGDLLSTIAPMATALSLLAGESPDDAFAKARLDAVEDATLALESKQREIFRLIGDAMAKSAGARARVYTEDLVRLEAARHLNLDEARAAAEHLGPVASSGLRFALDALDPDVVPHIARLVTRYSGRLVDVRFRAIARTLADLTAGELANFRRLVEALAEAAWCTRERRALDGSNMGDPPDAARVTICRTSNMHSNPNADVDVLPRPPDTLLRGIGPGSPLFDVLLQNRLADTPRFDELRPNVRIDNRIAMVRHEIIDELREVLELPPPRLPRGA